MNKTKITYFFLLIIALFFIVYYSQRGITSNASLSIEESEKFTKEEIDEAVVAVKRKFRGFDGCEMTKLWYSEKDSEIAIESYFNSGGEPTIDIKKENVIVLFSNFEVDSSGAKNGFNPNSTYTDWNWILVRNSKTDNWRVKDWGY